MSIANIFAARGGFPMLRAMLLVGLLVTNLGLVVTSASAKVQETELVAVCHQRGTADQKTLMLPETAVRAHLRQGDTLGPCQPPPGAVACPVARVDAGPPMQAVLTFQDTSPASLFLRVTQATNANVIIPSFDPDTADPVVVTATKVDQAQIATVVIRVTLNTDSTSSAKFCTTTF
jgi:hypothetical protein